MVMGLIPVVGVPLPLISYGGTAMVTVMLGFGLLMNVGIHRDVRISRRGRAASADRHRACAGPAAHVFGCGEEERWPKKRKRQSPAAGCM